MTSYIKARDWEGKDLKGTWEVTLKIDGVRALWQGGQWVSRAGKPLYNIPPAHRDGKGPNDIEVYIHDHAPDQKRCFKDTIRATRSQTLKATDGCSLQKCKCLTKVDPTNRGAKVIRTSCPKWEIATPLIQPEHMYSLDPLDVRLYGCMLYSAEHAENDLRAASQIVDPEASFITLLMKQANSRGYEGLVLRQGDTWLKVKPKPTWDVLILGVIEGAGKRKGHIGAFMTSKGKVGGFRGLSYADLKALWDQHAGHINDSGVAGVLEGPLKGQTIEVEAMGLTNEGKFRQPRCIRFRPDKTAEE